MKFIVDVPKSKIIETLINEGEIAENITDKDLCDFILSSIGLQIDSLNPKTEISVMISEPPICD